MTEPNALAAAQRAIVRGLLPAEQLVAAVGLRPVAEVDPSASTRKELFAQSKRSKHRLASAALRWNDRWNALTDTGYAHDEPPRRDVDRARAATTGNADSVAVALVRCWLDVPDRTTWLYLTDARWIVTTTVEAERGRPSGLQSDSVVGLVRHLVDVVRETPEDDGLPARLPDGSPGTVVSWAADRESVQARRSAVGVRLEFPDDSGLELRPVTSAADLERVLVPLIDAGVISRELRS